MWRAQFPAPGPYLHLHARLWKCQFSTQHLITLSCSGSQTDVSRGDTLPRRGRERETVREEEEEEKEVKFCPGTPTTHTPPAQSEKHRGEQGEAAVNCRGRCRCMQARKRWMLSDSLIDVMSKVGRACLVLPWNISSGTDRLRWWSLISCHVLPCT